MRSLPYNSAPNSELPSSCCSSFPGCESSEQPPPCQLSVSKKHLIIPCSELIYLSKDTAQFIPGDSQHSPHYRCQVLLETEMQALPQRWSSRSVAVTDKMSPWNCTDKAAKAANRPTRVSPVVISILIGDIGFSGIVLIL